ncbi:hypothetical protein D3C83_122380 [compost metagenome]
MSLDQGSGIIIMTAWATGRPARTRSSRVLSNIAESEPLGLMMGRILAMSSPKASDSKRASRACIQLMLPRRVLISPLWAT